MHLWGHAHSQLTFPLCIRIAGLMLGARNRFYFKDRTPPLVVIVMSLFFANLILSFVPDLWIGRFAPKHPTGAYLFRVQLRPDAIGLVRKWLAVYQTASLWIGFSILGLLFLLWFVYWLKGDVVRAD